MGRTELCVWVAVELLAMVRRRDPRQPTWRLLIGTDLSVRPGNDDSVNSIMYRLRLDGVPARDVGVVGMTRAPPSVAQAKASLAHNRNNGRSPVDENAREMETTSRRLSGC